VNELNETLTGDESQIRQLISDRPVVTVIVKSLKKPA